MVAKKLERERQLAAEAERKRLVETEAQKQAQIDKHRRAELERQRKQALVGLTYDAATHDWSAGGPFAYNCVQIGTMSKDWEADLTKIINREAAKGWEYYRSESLMILRPQGCLGVLFGMASDHYQVVVLIFRKPAIVVASDIRVREELGL